MKYIECTKNRSRNYEKGREGIVLLYDTVNFCDYVRAMADRGKHDYGTLVDW